MPCSDGHGKKRKSSSKERIGAAKKAKGVSLSEWLRTVAKQRAQAEAQKLKLPAKTHQQLILPQLSIISKISRKKQHDLDFKGHYNRRSDQLPLPKKGSVYVQLRDVFTDSSTNKAHGAKRQDKIVAFLGQAGIGKSTITRILVKQILEKKILTNIEYIFYIPFRGMNFASPHGFVEFLFSGETLSFNGKPVDEQELLNVLGDGEGVILIHDGLDEANGSCFQSANPLPSDLTAATADVHVKRLLSNKVLPKAVKVLTSRLKSFVEMPKSYQPLMVDILGFDDSARQTLCQQLCPSQDVFTRVTKYLKDHPDIASLCSVAANCACILYALSKNSERGSVELVSTTDIYARVLASCTSQLTAKYRHAIVKNLTLLAMNGFVDGKLTFTEVDFQNAGLNANHLQKLSQAFSDQQCHLDLKLIDGGTASGHFAHYTWQEFFTALHLLLYTPFKDFVSQTKHLFDSKWEVVATFLYGFCNQAVFSQVKKVFKPCDENLVKRKKEKLRILALDRMKNLDPHNTLELLTLCCWLKEMKDDSVNQDVLQHLPSHITLSGPVFHTDVSGLVYALKSSQDKVTLKINCREDEQTQGTVIKKAEFGEGCLRELLRLLGEAKLKRFEIRKIFKPEHCQLLNGVFTSCDEVALCRCSLTSCCVEPLAKCLMSSCGHLSELDLSRNSIGKKGAKLISTALDKVQRLRLSKCALNHTGIRFVTKACKELKNPISMLDFSQNIVEETKSPFIKFLHNIESLNLSDCSLTSSDIGDLARSCGELKKPLASLDLSRNKIGDAGATLLCKALRNIDDLNLSECLITSEGFAKLALEYKELDKPVKRVNFSGNLLGHAAFKALKSSMKNIGELVLTQYKVTCDNFVETGKATNKGNLKPNVHLDSKVKRVALRRGDDILPGDVMVAALSLRVNQLNEISIQNYSLTSAGVRELVSAIKARARALTTLDISGNKIGDAGASALAEAVQKVDQLNVAGCGLTSKGIIELARAYKAMKKPNKLLNVTHNVFGKEAFDALISCAKNIKQLVVTRYDVTADDIKENGEVTIEGVPRSEDVINSDVTRVRIKGPNTGDGLTGDEKAAILSIFADQFDEIKLTSHLLASAGVQELAYSLKHRSGPLRLLDLSQSYFMNNEAMELSCVLDKVDGLVLRHCNLDEDTVCEFAKALKTRQTPISLLDLSRNYLGDDEALALAAVLGKIERLSLGRSRLTHKSFSAFAEACEARATALELLDLSGRKTGDSVVSVFGKAFHNINHLNFSHCAITSDGAVKLVEALQQQRRKMKSLHIGGNVIGKKGFDLLSSRAINAEEVIFTRYRVTADSVVEDGDVSADGAFPANLVVPCDSKKVEVNWRLGESSGDAKAAAMSLCLDQIDELHMRSCGITCTGLRELVHALCQRPTPIHHLDLSSNKIQRGDEILALAVHKIDRLVLRWCDLILNRYEEFVEALKRRETPMEHLELTDVGSVGIGYIASAVHKIDHLVLDRGHLRSQHAVTLAQACCERENPMAQLSIEWNEIGDEGAQAFATALHKIDRLRLCLCAIKDPGVVALAGALQRREAPMELLDIRSNSVGEEGARRLALAMHNVRRLGLSSCEIDVDALRLLTDGLQRLAAPIHDLDLGFNEFGDEGAMLVAGSLHQVDRLRLDSCRIQRRGLKALAAAVKQRERPLEYLALCKNSYDDSDLTMFAESLDKISELDVRSPYHSSNVTDVGKSALRSAAGKLRPVPTVLCD